MKCLKGVVLLDLTDQENVFISKRFTLRYANINDLNLGSHNML